MKNKILDYIGINILEGDENITVETLLYSSGLISSMGHLKIISWLEKTFEIVVPMNEVSIKNFDSVDMIYEFTLSKM